MPPKQYYMLPGAATNAHFAKLSQQYQQQQQQQQQQASGTSPLTSSNAASPATPAANNQQAPSVSLTGLFPGSQPAGNNLSLPVSPYSVANNTLPGLSIQPQAPAYQPSSINSAPPGIMQQPVSTSQLVAPTGWSQALFTGQTSPSTNTTGPAKGATTTSTGATTTGPTTTGPTTGSQSSGSSSSSSQKESESHSTTTPVVMNQGDIDYVKDENKKLANANVDAALSLSTMAGLGSPDYNTISNNVGYIAGTSFIPAAPLYAPEQLPKAEIGHQTQSDSYSYATAQSQSQRQSSGNGGGAHKKFGAPLVPNINYTAGTIENIDPSSVKLDAGGMHKSLDPTRASQHSAQYWKVYADQQMKAKIKIPAFQRDSSGGFVYKGDMTVELAGTPDEIVNQTYKAYMTKDIYDQAGGDYGKFNNLLKSITSNYSRSAGRQPATSGRYLTYKPLIFDESHRDAVDRVKNKTAAAIGIVAGQKKFTGFMDQLVRQKGGIIDEYRRNAIGNGQEGEWYGGMNNSVLNSLQTMGVWDTK